MDSKIGMIKHAARKLTTRQLDQVLKRGRRVIDFLTSISFDRVKKSFGDTDIEISNPRDIRDTIEKYLKEKSRERAKDLLSLVYFQINSVVTSGVDESLIQGFFQEVVHIEFDDGCDRMNLYEFTINSYDKSSKWYALMSVFLSKMCRKWSHCISYPLLDVQKPGTNKRIRNVYRVFHLLYDIYPRMPKGCEYKIGIPPIKTPGPVGTLNLDGIDTGTGVGTNTSLKVPSGRRRSTSPRNKQSNL